MIGYLVLFIIVYIFMSLGSVIFLSENQFAYAEYDYNPPVLFSIFLKALPLLILVILKLIWNMFYFMIPWDYEKKLLKEIEKDKKGKRQSKWVKKTARKILKQALRDFRNGEHRTAYVGRVSKNQALLLEAHFEEVSGVYFMRADFISSNKRKLVFRIENPEVEMERIFAESYNELEETAEC